MFAFSLPTGRSVFSIYFTQGIHASATIDGTVFYDGATQDGNSHPAFRKQVNGKYIFFKAEGDIYWVDAKIIEKFKPEELK
jgi:hypothetical protein